jgi:FkbM family methyltransferase
MTSKVRYTLRQVGRSILLNYAPTIYRLLNSPFRSWLYYYLGMVHEPEFRLLKRVLGSDNPVVVDIGANHGQSILSIMRLFPKAQIVSFEPNVANEEMLRHIASKFEGQITINMCALSDHDGSVPLFWPVYNGQPVTTLASLEPDHAREWLEQNMPVFDPKKLLMKSLDVPLRQLDDLGLSPDVIKIDAEGAEGSVVRGSLETIRSCKPVILLESFGAETEERLREFGYSELEVGRDFRRLHVFVPGRNGA